MNRAHALLVACLPLAVGACSASPSDERVATSHAALGAEQTASPVFVFDSGHWSDGGEEGATSESFWVDLSVRNDAYSKDAGIVWTTDGWTTTHTSHASYKGALAGGRERWGVQQSDFAWSAPWQPLEVEYAAYATMNGVTSWSPFRNHYIYEGVSPAKPVRLLSSSLAMGADDRPILHGVARALNVTGARHVWIRSTVDAWRTYADVEAPFDGKDFSFAIPLTVVPANANEVSYAVRFDAEGESAWDNDGGANYVLAIAPALTSASLPNDLARPAAGVRLFQGSVHTALPIDQIWVHVDGGPRVPLAPLVAGAPTSEGFSPDGGFLYAFGDSALADGAHVIAVEAAAGPFVRSFAPVSFHVAHGIAYRATWQLAPAPQTDVWDFARDAAGRVYVSGETGVVMYATDGAATPSLTFAPAPLATTFMDVAVDASSRVYALGATTVVRWLSTGAVDASFGVNGALDLSVGTFGTSAFCYPSNLDVAGGDLVVVDSCNARVVRLTLDGAFVDEVSLAVAGAYTNVQHTFRDGDDVWVSRVSGAALTNDLVRLSAAAGAPLHVAATMPVDPAIANIDAIAVTAGDAWVADFGGNLWHLGAGGTASAIWLGGNGAGTTPGAIGIVKEIAPVAPGTIEALSVAGARIDRFAVTTGN